jgi:AcrR family transcriptional regulator
LSRAFNALRVQATNRSDIHLQRYDLCANLVFTKLMHTNRRNATVRMTSQERRDCILATAVRLFSDKGFRGTTTKELAQAVGVTEPVLYQHFSTKRDLYSAIIEELVRTCAPGIGQLGAAEGDRAFLTRLANGIIDWHLEKPEYLRLLLFSALEGYESGDLVSLFHERYARVFMDELVEFFARRMEQGVFRSMDPVVMSNSFIGLAAHYSTQLTLFPKGRPPVERHQMVEGFIDIFLEGIQNRDPQS